MLTIFGSQPKRSGYCDGVSRRNFLKIGALSLGGLSLPQIFTFDLVSMSSMIGLLSATVLPRFWLCFPVAVACSLVAAGAGITLVPRWAAEQFSGPSVSVRPVKEQLSSRCAIIYPDPGPRLALAESFATHLRDELRRIGKRACSG